jgi:YebC/PmpR family DNA-binding regulatory protein
MSGHSKWSTIKRKKAAVDAKRGAVFTRLAREIAVAARKSGADLETNFQLRLAVDRAKNANMPKNNIERAIKRGTGEDKEGVAFEDLYYEGYGPHGVAFMIECATDNRNRTVADLRHILIASGGSLGEDGSVAWQFEQASFFTFPVDDRSEDYLFELALACSADDFSIENDMVEFTGPTSVFKTINDGLVQVSIKPTDAGLRMDPKQEIALEPDQAAQVLRVIDNLEELDDVQNVYSNLSITDEALAKYEA